MTKFLFGKRFEEWGGWYGLLILGLHTLGIGLLLVNVWQHPQLLAMGFLAYTLGLRHAFDPDHIAAIDNSVRTLTQTGGRPHGIGFFFAMGHSTVVFLLACGIALGSTWVASQIPAWQAVGSVVGPLVSGLFLLLIGLINLGLWFNVFGVFRRLRRGAEPVSDAEITAPGGLIMRVGRPLFRLVRKSWHLYPLGFLFGLGFDTASEIALLALSAQGAAQALPWSAILCLPVLFAAGMTLLDTADGLLMTRAYRWALANPLRKVYYNMCVTGISVLVAVVIGGVELLQVLAKQFGWNDSVGLAIQAIDFGTLGFVVVGILLGAWLISSLVWRRLASPAK